MPDRNRIGGLDLRQGGLSILREDARGHSGHHGGCEQCGPVHDVPQSFRWLSIALRSADNHMLPYQNKLQHMLTTEGWRVVRRCRGSSPSDPALIKKAASSHDAHPCLMVFNGLICIHSNS